VSDELARRPPLYLGPSRSASLLEVIVVMRGSDRSALAIHAMQMQEKYRRLPAMGSSAASVESVRLDPELSEALRERAEHEGRTNSDLIRDALGRYLRAS
jgi:hypothetical protein